MNARDPFVEIAAGTAIFREGEPGDAMYIVESGTVELVRAARGEPHASLGAGECFGEMALLEEQPRFATAIAKTPVRLLRIERGELGDVLRANAEIPLRMLRQLSARLRRSEQRAQDAHGALEEFKRKLSSRRDEPRAEPAAAPAAAVQSAIAAPAPAAIPSPAQEVPFAAPAPPPPAAPRTPELRLESGETFPLAGGTEFLVGRPDPASGIHPEIDLGPHDVARSLSRRHAKIVRQGDAWAVREDAATTNGTFVNGERISTGQPVVLKPGDRIKFGSVEVEWIA